MKFCYVHRSHNINTQTPSNELFAFVQVLFVQTQLFCLFYYVLISTLFWLHYYLELQALIYCLLLFFVGPILFCANPVAWVGSVVEEDRLARG